MRKTQLLLLITAVIFVAVRCGEGPSEPVVHTHTQAGFKITAPAGWSLMSQDEEMFEFRHGDVQLIEVGGFDLEMGPEDFEDVSMDEFMNTLRDGTRDGLDGYCEEAEIVDWRVKEQKETTWGGEPAYHIRAEGYSEAAETDMVVDLVSCMHKQSGFMYMFASQIAAGDYEKVKTDLKATISSFTITK